MAEMPSIIFLTYHGIGHFNACFKIAKILQIQYRVVFASFGSFKNYVEGQGFSFYPLNTVPFGLGFEQWQNSTEKKKNIHIHSIKDRWTNRLYKLREAELNKLLEEVKPRFILIDSLQSTDFILVYPYAKVFLVKVGFIQTMLPQVVKKNCPPINSLVFPDEMKKVNKAVFRFHFSRFVKLMMAKIQFIGKTNSEIIGSAMEINQVNKIYHSKEVTPMSIPFNNIDELILAPPEFDIPQYNNSAFEHYVGFMLDEQRSEIFNKEFMAIQEKVSTSNDPLIYCSFGTVKLNHTTTIVTFIKKLVNVVRDKPCWLIISTAFAQQLKINFKLPAHVFVLNSVPQLQILSKANLFITHGGLNSIKEAIYACVPMLAYPVNPQLDQNGNSMRVAFHQLGLLGYIKNDSEIIIWYKINELLKNPIYKIKILELKAKDNAYTPETFMRLFHNLRPPV
jgi:UDP:flavonoid glycosyltransferase YjiC (YdhE family)